MIHYKNPIVNVRTARKVRRFLEDHDLLKRVAFYVKTRRNTDFTLRWIMKTQRNIATPERNTVLAGCFVWGATTEGHTFWYTVNEKLLKELES